MQQLITVLHILISICVIALVLIQRGKGADVGASFGSGASQTMFGSQGATPFLVKLTAGLALLFFVTSGVLSFIIGKHARQDNLLVTPAAPVMPFLPQSSSSNAPSVPAPAQAKPVEMTK